MPGIMGDDEKRLRQMNMLLDRELEKRNEVEFGDAIVVRVPNVPGRIRKIPRGKREGNYSVEYISKRWYDKEAGQPRNEKHIIGVILADFPRAMLPNDNYYDYFDGATGLPRKKPEEDKESEPVDSSTPPGKTASARSDHPTPPEKTNDPDKTNQTDDIDETDDTDETDNIILETINRSREMFAEANRKKKEQAEREERRKRNQELYGEGYEDEAETQESIRSLMKIFEETGAEMPETRQENPNPQDEQTPEEPENASGLTLQQAYAEYSQGKERTAILFHILEKIIGSVQTQARKRPDTVVNAYKITRINGILQEIREYCRGTGYEDLMETIDLPKERKENGVTIIEGISYSDLEILLDHYYTILYFKQPWNLKTNTKR